MDIKMSQYKTFLAHMHTFFHNSVDVLEHHKDMNVVQTLNGCMLYVDGIYKDMFSLEEFEDAIVFHGNKLSNQYANPGAYMFH